MIETILVATDGSEGGNTAEKAGVFLAARLRVRLSGITVVEDGDVHRFARKFASNLAEVWADLVRLLRRNIDA